MVGVLLVGNGLVVLLAVVVDAEEEVDGGGEVVEEVEEVEEEEAQCRGVRWIVEIGGIRSRSWRRLILLHRIRHE